MKRKVFAVLVAMIFMACVFSCAGDSGRSNPADLGEGPAPDPKQVTEVTVGIPLNEEDLWQPTLVTPGVPPGTIEVFGTIESRVCYDPYSGCAVDRTSQVVGGVLNISYTVPVNTYLHIGYALDNQLRFDGITINGVPLYNLPAMDGTPITNIGMLGGAPNNYGVACFIVNRNQDGVVSVNGNPGCNQTPYRLRIRVTGDNNANGVYDAPFDDTLVPLTGSQAGEEYRYQTSLWLDPMPGGIWQTLVWDPATTSYSETYYSVLSSQAMWFGVHNPCRDPLAPPGCYEPRFGVWADVIPFGGGGVLCSTNLVHYEDVDTGAGFWIVALTDGISTATNCILQGADTRGVVVSGP
ncbi:MAG TPA: hypothetical protein ENN28_00035 [Candidatus Uhrbacteria bacterium]|nr:hypothetical protein [Candidatus Uhrbacteria bacterium]